MKSAHIFKALISLAGLALPLLFGCQQSHDFSLSNDGTGIAQGDGNILSGDVNPVNIPNDNPGDDPGDNPGDDPGDDPIDDPADPEDQSCGEESGFTVYRDDNCDGEADLDGYGEPILEHDIVVIDWEGHRKDCAIIHVEEDGVWQMFDLFADSGARQQNETAFVLVRNSVNPSGEPLAQPNPAVPNCAFPDSEAPDGTLEVFVVEDADNEGVRNNNTYYGAFPLKAGEPNHLQLRHYCPVYRAGFCEEFNHDTTDTCANVSTTNSVHMDGNFFCVKKL